MEFCSIVANLNHFVASKLSSLMYSMSLCPPEHILVVFVASLTKQAPSKEKKEMTIVIPSQSQRSDVQ